MNLGNKLKSIRHQNGMSMEELRNLLNRKYDLNISRSMISRWENGKSEPLNTYLSAYAKEFNIDMNYLLGIDVTSLPGVIPVKNLKKIPILGHIQCGQPVMSVENYEGYFSADPDVINSDFCLYADGDSMIEVNIHEGDLIFFKETPQVENGKIAAVLIDDATTLKRFYKNEAEIVLQPENKNYSPIIIREGDGQNIKILGEMVGMYSKGSK